jgi:4-hydroxy-3-methylbut-2-en-1-yl diphosphate reductase
MEINIAKSAGFCFGVKRALKIAMQAAKSENRVEMLGDIVHNEDVIKDLTNAGIRKVSSLTNGNGKTLLIRAHGVSLKTIKRAEKLGYKIIDATCPMVREIHKIASDMEKQGYTIIIIGSEKHAEVQGIVGQLKSSPVVIDPQQKIPVNKIKSIQKAGIVVQSTQNVDQVNKTVSQLQQHLPNIKFCDTICETTKAKQNEIKEMPLNNDVMIIIGSKRSANTKRLYKIAKSINQKSYWVQSKKDINTEWFYNAKKAGITAGASTPDYITDGVIAKIRQINEC